MKYKLTKLKELSGFQASVYTVYLTGKRKTLFETFLGENFNSFLSELNEMVKRLKAIGHKTGARECFFKLNEGNPGDGICALYDEPKSKLRLYCIRYGTSLIVVGGGGEKPKKIKAFQENDKLAKENFLLRKVSTQISARMKDGGIQFSDNYMDFEGNLEFNLENDE